VTAQRAVLAARFCAAFHLTNRRALVSGLLARVLVIRRMRSYPVPEIDVALLGVDGPVLHCGRHGETPGGMLARFLVNERMMPQGRVARVAIKELACFSNRCLNRLRQRRVLLAKVSGGAVSRPKRTRQSRHRDAR